jgi:hypothetical protein
MPAHYLKATTMDPAQHTVPQRPDPAAIELLDEEFEREERAKGRDSALPLIGYARWSRVARSMSSPHGRWIGSADRSRTS